MSWNYPLSFYHHGIDWQIRDAKLKAVIRINIEGMDFLQQKEIEKFCLEVVDKMNTSNFIVPQIPEVVMSAPAENINGNGHGKKFDRAAHMREYWRKRREGAK